MGITVHYRGRLADLARVEDLEDRALDLVLELGGLARIWRTYDEDSPERMIRGLIVHLAPGQDSTSLLISPEGWLIGLTDIEDAERGRLGEPPWCFAKTQFGPIVGHVALVEMLRALKQEFMPDLEVSDEGGYWETSDLQELARRQQFLGKAIEGLAEGLRQYGLSREAAEDRDILIRHIERIAGIVHRTLRRPAEHPPIEFPDESEYAPADPEAEERLWDQMYKHNRRQQERLNRGMEERLSGGQDHDEAFDDAMKEDLCLDIPGEDKGDDEEPWESDDSEEFGDAEHEIATEDEDVAWKEPERHPLLRTASDLMVRLRKAFGGTDPKFAAAKETLFHGAGDAVGGLSQALARHDDDDDDLVQRGLQIVQLKRALRGAAFAWGALFHLREAADEVTIRELMDSYEELQRGMMEELGRLRGAK